ncbi:hypothetical protein OH77DRAFT_171131 [Trametes cingulata]|nr:hypothetical protein OH77DRAFT_171131 [Trametes cingulata]
MAPARATHGGTLPMESAALSQNSVERYTPFLTSLELRGDMDERHLISRARENTGLRSRGWLSTPPSPRSRCDGAGSEHAGVSIGQVVLQGAMLGPPNNTVRRTSRRFMILRDMLDYAWYEWRRGWWRYFHRRPIHCGNRRRSLQDSCTSATALISTRRWLS